MKKKKISFSWSGGKDSAFALLQLEADSSLEIAELHTVIGKETQRVGLHGTKRELIEAQAKSLGYPLKIIELPADNTNASYEKVMSTFYGALKQRNISALGFGDIFLADLKDYREALMKPYALESFYPIWKKSTESLSKEIIESVIRTIICAGNQMISSKEAVGTEYTHSFLLGLSDDIDPCGENGEFHSYVFDSPNFRTPIVVKNDGNHFKSYQIKNEDGTEEQISFEFADLSLQ